MLSEIDPEAALAIAYAPAACRADLQALWALDARLAAIVRRARDPMVGQLRLTWWHEALSKLDVGPPPAEPLLRALSAGPNSGAELARIVAGWEVLLDQLDDPALETHARERGGTLFAAAGRVLGVGDDIAASGEGWALVDLAEHLTDPVAAARARALAGERLRGQRRSRAARPLAMLATLAARDAARDPAARRRQGSPARMLAMARVALLG